MQAAARASAQLACSRHRSRCVRVQAADSGASPSSSTTTAQHPHASTSTHAAGTVGRGRESDHQRRFTQEDYDMLPHRIILIRHAESMGNVERNTYCVQPDHTVVLTEKGREQARQAGRNIQAMLREKHGGDNYKLFIMTSPYTRTLETTDRLLEPFTDDQVAAVRSAVQLREQDFGNFQDPLRITQDLNDRMKFGRFWFRFPNGESGADVYDRLTVFEDHLTRDMMMGRFTNCSMMLVTHGLTLRIFLMRWFHWSVEDFLQVYNPGNCDPVILEKHPWDVIQKLQGDKWVHVKQCYAMASDSRKKLKGCSVDMADYSIRSSQSGGAKTLWMMQRAAQQLSQMAAQQEAATEAAKAGVPPPPLPPGLTFAGVGLPPGVRGAASPLLSVALQSIVEDPYGSLSEDEAIDWWKGGYARSVLDLDEAAAAVSAAEGNGRQP